MRGASLLLAVFLIFLHHDQVGDLAGVVARAPGARVQRPMRPICVPLDGEVEVGGLWDRSR